MTLCFIKVILKIENLYVFLIAYASIQGQVRAINKVLLKGDVEWFESCHSVALISECFRGPF
jgi:hypothetical protein